MSEPKKEDAWLKSASGRWVLLSLLVVQNTVLVLLMRESRASGDAATRYLSSTAVVMAEIVKVFVACLLLRYTSLRSWSEAFSLIKQELRHTDTLKLAVPGLLYLIQNNLLYVALSNLDAAVYQVTYQLKILTTALFSVLLLGRSLSMEQVFSLLMLAYGVALVQYSEISENGKRAEKKGDEDPWLGLMCVLLGCFSSGFAGVYLEKVMKKGREVSIWIRNIQLGLLGTVFGLFVIFANPKEYAIVQEDGFLRGYNAIVWSVVLVQAVGGLIVALVIQYADNILKGFATSISIVLSSLVSVFFFSVHLTSTFLMGAAFVIVAVIIFGRS